MNVCRACTCTAPVPERVLMCEFHWARVPFDLQRRVMAAFQRGQPNHVSPSDEWLDAVEEALAIVDGISRRERQASR